MKTDFHIPLILFILLLTTLLIFIYMNIELPSYSAVETTKLEVQFETIEFTATTQPESNDDKSGFPTFTLLGLFFGSGIAIVVVLLFWDN